MDRAGLTMALGGDQFGVDGDTPTVDELRLRPLRLALTTVAFGFLKHALGSGIPRLKQVFLTGDGVLEPAGAFNPLLARSRAQVSERTKGFLARSVRRSQRLDQLVIDVGLALVSARRAAEKHTTTHHDSPNA
jgi:hypothetical protein